MENITQTEKNKSYIVFILVGISLIITIIIATLCNQNYKEYWNNWDMNSKSYEGLESKWETSKIATIISIIVTDILFVAGSIIQFVKNKKNKKDIIILLIGLVVMIGFTIGCVFLGKLN